MNFNIPENNRLCSKFSQLLAYSTVKIPLADLLRAGYRDPVTFSLVREMTEAHIVHSV